MPPDTGGNSPTNEMYDVIGRMYRIRVTFGC
jgi:hypothetical protein